MISRILLLALMVVPVFARQRVATFEADATPFLGEPLIWTTPAKQILDPLRAKGIVIEQDSKRYVLVSVDWCGIGGELFVKLRAAIARGAGTPESNVALHTIHQHTAPYIDGDGYRLLAAAHRPALGLSPKFQKALETRLESAVRQSIKRLQAFDQVGTGEAKVDRVASARRITGPDGKQITRWSSSAKTPELAAYPEGPIDPFVRTITFARAGKPLVRLHFYATHPQTFCCDGRVTADIVGAARDAVEKADKTFQIYFTGAAGDVTMGKYNDGSEAKRTQLAGRLEQGLMASITATTLHPAGAVTWRQKDFDPPRKPMQTLYWTTGKPSRDDLDCRSANEAAFILRKRPLSIQFLDLGAAKVVFLPGEPMLEFQKFARSLEPDQFVAVAGYGEISPGYVCTDEAHSQGGYEPSASYTSSGTEPALKEAIRAIMR